MKVARVAERDLFLKFKSSLFIRDFFFTATDNFIKGFQYFRLENLDNFDQSDFDVPRFLLILIHLVRIAPQGSVNFLHICSTRLRR
jgi:hypothetical protein